MGVIQGGARVLTHLPHLLADPDSNSLLRPLRSTGALALGGRSQPEHMAIRDVVEPTAAWTAGNPDP